MTILYLATALETRLPKTSTCLSLIVKLRLCAYAGLSSVRKERIGTFVCKVLLILR